MNIRRYISRKILFSVVFICLLAVLSVYNYNIYGQEKYNSDFKFTEADSEYAISDLNSRLPSEKRKLSRRQQKLEAKKLDDICPDYSFINENKGLKSVLCHRYFHQLQEYFNRTCLSAFLSLTITGRAPPVYLCS